MEIINGHTGKAHVTAEQSRDLNQGIVGTESYVLDVGDKLRMEVVSNNEIRIHDGIIVHQGCAASIGKNKYDSLTIENGTQGQKRIDLIVARYSRQSDGVESVDTMVIKGTSVASNPQAPTYKMGDIQLGDTVDMPLYTVELDGLSIVSISRLYKTVSPAAKLSGKCAYSYDDYIAPEIVVNAGEGSYTIKTDTIHTSGGKCLVTVYGALKTSASAVAASLQVNVGGKMAAYARTCSTTGVNVIGTGVVELDAGDYEIEMTIRPEASQNASATLCKYHELGMTCMEV